MRYGLYNVTDKLVNNPCKIMNINAIDFETALLKAKSELSKGLKEQLNLIEGTKISFTPPKTNESLGYGSGIKYITCSIEDKNGFIIDIFEYALGIEGGI